MLTAPVLPLAPTTPPVANPAAPQVSGPGFAESLASVLSDVNSTAAQANAAVGRMIDGTGDVHEGITNHSGGGGQTYPARRIFMVISRIAAAQ